MKFYLLQVLIALDQLLNALFFRGWADETLSSRAYRSSRKTGSWRWQVCATIINWLARNKNHCYEAFLSERNNNQLPPEFRNGLKND